VLLEIIVALTVFAVVVGGLASVLHGSLDSANALRRTAAIRRGMEAVLIEARLQPKREEMILTATDEGLGMEYH
jgi:type II secretory pathway pseudopilin PulG